MDQRTSSLFVSWWFASRWGEAGGRGLARFGTPGERFLRSINHLNLKLGRIRCNAQFCGPENLTPRNSMAMFRSSRRQAAFDFDLLMPETPTRRTARTTGPDRDVVDAEFVTIKENRARQPGNDNRGTTSQHKAKPPVTVGAVGLALIGWLDRRLSRLSADAYSALVAGLAIFVFICSGGLSVVVPEKTAVAASVNPLAISHVTITPQEAGGMDILLINGIVENNGGDLEEVPAIRADLFAAKGQLVASMVIEPPVKQMQPGLSHGFSAKLRHPGGKTPEIKLSFVEAGAPGR
ncbi:Hypothetical protein AT6N2_L1763 [Agrobacterium tumefaciens]|nr:Hypothetical protein AT6N2_L1763 [Agrobacterium tumefaciens]